MPAEWALKLTDQEREGYLIFQASPAATPPSKPQRLRAFQSTAL
jgi:hypothetical protein